VPGRERGDAAGGDRDGGLVDAEEFARQAEWHAQPQVAGSGGDDGLAGEFPAGRRRWPCGGRGAGSIGLMSAILGVGGGFGLVLGGLIGGHLSWHWLFWIPLVAMALAAVCSWRFIPESKVRAPTGSAGWPRAC